MSDLARHHQIHGLQPVLPVADVEAAAAWLQRVLGFEPDFLWGTPVTHGRVKIVGDWGAPIYIHLSRAGDGVHVQPCGELRLHVGNDVDALWRHCVAEGAEVLEPPADQPWGLREFVLRMPDGHLLCLGAEIG